MRLVASGALQRLADQLPFDILEVDALDREGHAAFLPACIQGGGRSASLVDSATALVKCGNGEWTPK